MVMLASLLPVKSKLPGLVAGPGIQTAATMVRVAFEPLLGVFERSLRFYLHTILGSCFFRPLLCPTVTRREEPEGDKEAKCHGVGIWAYEIR